MQPSCSVRAQVGSRGCLTGGLALSQLSEPNRGEETDPQKSVLVQLVRPDQNERMKRVPEVRDHDGHSTVWKFGAQV